MYIVSPSKHAYVRKHAYVHTNIKLRTKSVLGDDHVVTWWSKLKPSLYFVHQFISVLWYKLVNIGTQCEFLQVCLLQNIV